MTWLNVLSNGDLDSTKNSAFGILQHFGMGTWRIRGSWKESPIQGLIFRVPFLKLKMVDVCDVSGVDQWMSFNLNRRLSGQLAVYNFEGGPCLRCAA